MATSTDDRPISDGAIVAVLRPFVRATRPVLAMNSTPSDIDVQPSPLPNAREAAPRTAEVGGCVPCE